MFDSERSKPTFFFPFRSRERVGLRREKSVFVLRDGSLISFVGTQSGRSNAALPEAKFGHGVEDGREVGMRGRGGRGRKRSHVHPTLTAFNMRFRRRIQGYGTMRM